MAQQDYINAMRSLFSSDQEVQDFLDSFREPLPKTIKHLASRMDADTFKKVFTQYGWNISPTQFANFDDMYVVDRGDITQALWKDFLHLLGFFYIQELAASTSPHFMDIPDNWLILDMCASPWGKTVQLADYALAAGKNTLVIANEFNSKRIPALGSNLTRTAMYNTVITKFNGAVFGTKHPEMFDAVLLDAPCSGEWTWFKSDAAFKRRNFENIHKIARTQDMLLTSAIKACKPWWSIVYSTCTLNPIENEQIIQNILEKYPDILELEELILPGAERGVMTFEDREIIDPAIAQSCVRCRPHKQHTGWFFVAKLRKKTSQFYKLPDRSIDTNSLQHFAIGSDVQNEVADYLSELFGITIDPEKYLFVRTPKNIYVTSPMFRHLHGMMAYDRVGVSIIKWSWPRDRRPEHACGLIFGSQATRNTQGLDVSQLEAYVAQKDIPFPWEDHGHRLLQRQWYGVWVGKIVDGTMKNKFVKVI